MAPAPSARREPGLPAHRREAIAGGKAATKRKVGSSGLDPDVLLDRPGHLSGERLITGPSYPSVPDACAVGQNSRQPKERLEGESDRTPHVLACAYRSLAHVQRSSRRLQSRMAGLVDTMGLIRPGVPAGANYENRLPSAQQDIDDKCEH